MDDLTLLDLLECPVCLEKLDVTAKVLPCQHTFCKPCLQRISKAHKGLRCPECRTLVFGSIEALPANLLLVRLLDGVRSGPGSGRGGSFRRPGVLALQDGRKSRTQPRGLQASPFRLVPNIRIHMDGVREISFVPILSTWRLHLCVPAVRVYHFQLRVKGGAARIPEREVSVGRDPPTEVWWGPDLSNPFCDS